MPLTAKGKKLKKKFEEQYGKKKGQSVFYAMENSGKLKKVVKARGGMDASRDDFGGGSKSSGDGGGRDPSAQFKTAGPVSQSSRQAMTAQRQTARARISPSTTLAGKAVSQILGSAIGIPYYGPKMVSRAIDYSPAAFGVPKGTKKKTTTTNVAEDRDQKIIKPIVVETMKPVDPTLVNPKQDFFAFKAFKVGGLSGGVRSGPPPKRGPNPQVPPVKMKKGGYKK